MTLSLLLLAAVAIFAIGNVARAIRILRAPAHIRWDLYPIPKGPRERQSYGGSYFEQSEWWTKPREKSSVGELTFVLKEVLLMHSVRRNFRALWLWSMAMHWGLYIYGTSIVAAIGLGFLHRTQLAGLVRSTFAASCVVGCAGTAGLLVSRLLMQRLKPFTTRSTLFNLIFLFAIFLTGSISVFVKTGTPAISISATVNHNGIESAHLILLSLFLVYFPFTHMTHMFMKYFTWHRVRWDDTTAVQDLRAIGQLSTNLERPISWHAAHISRNAPRSWAEALAREKTKQAHHA